MYDNTTSMIDDLISGGETVEIAARKKTVAEEVFDDATSLFPRGTPTLKN